MKKVIEKVLMKDLQQRCKLHRVLYFVCLQICESFIDLQFNEWKEFICVFLFSHQENSRHLHLVVEIVQSLLLRIIQLTRC